VAGFQKGIIFLIHSAEPIATQVPTGEAGGVNGMNSFQRNDEPDLWMAVRRAVIGFRACRPIPNASVSPALCADIYAAQQEARCFISSMMAKRIISSWIGARLVNQKFTFNCT
jgi:hypothetical protein